MFQVGVDTSSGQVSSAQFNSRISAKQNESCFALEGEEIIKNIAIGYRVSRGTMTADDECGQSLWLRLVKQDKPSLYKDVSTYLGRHTV
jgi:nitrogen fixation protein FixH